MVASLPCRICSSLKFLSFLVDILGPICGPVYSGCIWVTRPREKRQRTTCGMFRFSNRSGVWKTSSSGTPYFLAATRKAWTFSINMNAGPWTTTGHNLRELKVCLRGLDQVCQLPGNGIQTRLIYYYVTSN